MAREHRINAIENEITSCMNQLQNILPGYNNHETIETMINADLRPLPRRALLRPAVVRYEPIPENHFNSRGIPPCFKIGMYAGYKGPDSSNTIFIPRYSSKILYTQEIESHINSTSYSPTYYEADILKTAPWADSSNTSRIQFNTIDGRTNRKSYHGPYRFDTMIKTGQGKMESGNYPKNPVGKTGISGRGVLGKWGPNHAADPIVIKKDPGDGSIHIVCIKRKDTGDWAIPGGMVEPGDTFSITLIKEFMEEATNSLESPEEKNAATKEWLRIVFERAEIVYKGYVDDPRNTDNAWMETVAAAVVLNDEEAEQIKLEAGDDASHVKWVKYTPELQLYASHGKFIRAAISKLFGY